jgi:hypothetical protein
MAYHCLGKRFDKLKIAGIGITSQLVKKHVPVEYMGQEHSEEIAWSRK